MSDRQFEGKVAIVTGGVSGIGAACSLTFARGGARLVADLNEAEGNRIVSEIKASGSDAIFTRTDVARPEDVAAMIDAAITAFGRLDIAVNNAGIGGESNPTAEYSIEGWRKVID